MNLLFWYFYVALVSQVFTEDVIAIVSQIQNMTVDLGFNSCFFVSFLAGLLTIKMSPCKQRLMGRWRGEINTIKSDSRNILLLFKTHYSILFGRKRATQ